MKRNNEQVHNKHTQEIKQYPHILGLENIIMSTGEVLLFKPDGNIFRAPDNVLIDYNNRILYNVEYKCHGCRSKANVQLKQSGEMLRLMFDQFEVVNLYVHDNYKLEVIE